MHDIDRTFMENDSEYSNHDSEYSTGTDSEFNDEEFEFQSEEQESESDGVFNEDEVEQLAAELLSVSNEQELDYFIKNLAKSAFNKAKKWGKKAINSSVFKNVTGALRGVARQALPQVGAALGNMVVPGIGGAVGRMAAGKLGSYFGLELEGLSEEDQQYEIAKQFVRLAGDATKRAVALPAGNPNAIARKAIAAAAHKYAPGLVRRRVNGFTGGGQVVAGQQGTWIRKGKHIIVLNAV